MCQGWCLAAWQDGELLGGALMCHSTVLRVAALADGRSAQVTLTAGGGQTHGRTALGPKVGPQAMSWLPCCRVRPRAALRTREDGPAWD